MPGVPAIEITGLCKQYRRWRGRPTTALDGLDLQVDTGGVFGFLGPNGAGKTTTIRCLLGLAQPTAGRCRIFGCDSGAELPSVIQRVGSVVESPALFPTFSGRRNLELLAGIYRLPADRIDRVLGAVDLSDRAGDLVKRYSLGMRQRLAIAAALLKDPDLLILDEPANGLDPAGIREVRGLLRRLGQEGRTVFVSSHILAEVQQTCDRVAIMSRGRCVASGPVGEVLAQGRSTAMLVRADDQPRALAVLAAKGFPVRSQDGYLRVEVSADRGADISRALASQGIYAGELRPEHVDLETVFMQLTETEQEAAA